MKEKRHLLDDGSGRFAYNDGSHSQKSTRSSMNSQKGGSKKERNSSVKNPGYKYSEVSQHVASTHTTPSSKSNTLPNQKYQHPELQNEVAVDGTPGNYRSKVTSPNNAPKPVKNEAKSSKKRNDN